MASLSRNACWYAACMIGLMQPCFGADYPTKSIRLIVTSGAGGSPDIQARLIASELSKQMGQQVVVDNRPGASGIIGYEAIARAAPDGYTLGYASFTFITLPALYSKLPFDTGKDFVPIVQQTIGAALCTVTNGLPVRSVRDLIEYARAHPHKLSYGSSGAGTSFQLAVELFKIMTSAKIVMVSYKTQTQAVADTIAGQVHLICDNPPTMLPHVSAGRLRAIGVTTLTRLPAAPDIPSFAESGLPGFELIPSAGYVFPGQTARERVSRMNLEINTALRSPTVYDKITAAGSIVVGGSPEQFGEHLRKETAKWAGVIKAAGIKVE